MVWPGSTRGKGRRSNSRLLRHLQGTFGPMRVSAVFYLAHLAHAAHEGAKDPRLFAAGTLVVAVSVLVFGAMSAPGRRACARSAS